MTARSSTCDLERRHCPAAARHAELGTVRDRRGMEVGTCVHHFIHAVVSRMPSTAPQTAIDQAAVSLIADGRSFDGGPVEYPRMEAVDRARDLALDFLDREEIPEGAGWLRAELSVDLDAAFKVVERQLAPPAGCDGRGTGEDCECGSDQGCPWRRRAIWRQALDVVAIYQDEVDEQAVAVLELTDWKPVADIGGAGAWFSSLQGKAAAVSGVAIAEEQDAEIDIIRRRVVGYMPWGGRDQRDLSLHDPEDLELLEDYREAVRVAAAGHRGRAGKSPDELAAPGAGCYAGFDGFCPYLTHCKPAMRHWEGAFAKWTPGSSPEAAAFTWALASAVKEASGTVVKRALKAADQVTSEDGRTVVGWKKRNGSKVHENAPLLLAREWVEVMGRLEPGSDAAVAAATQLDGILSVKGALSVTTVRAIAKRLGDVIGRDEAEALLARCLIDHPKRELATWKANYDETPGLLEADLKRSLDDANHSES